MAPCRLGQRVPWEQAFVPRSLEVLGPFLGRWRTTDGSLHTIGVRAIRWAGGSETDISWRQVNGHVVLSVWLDGARYSAALTFSEELRWDDGDVWSRAGRYSQKEAALVEQIAAEAAPWLPWLQPPRIVCCSDQGDLIAHGFEEAADPRAADGKICEPLRPPDVKGLCAPAARAYSVAGRREQQGDCGGVAAHVAEGFGSNGVQIRDVPLPKQHAGPRQGRPRAFQAAQDGNSVSQPGYREAVF